MVKVPMNMKNHIELAKENNLKADIVVPVPDSENAAALGFANILV